jgi:hypothetical protein
VRLGRSRETTAAIAARRGLTADRLPPHQVSIPSPLDLCLFAFGIPAVAMGLLPKMAAVHAVNSALHYLPVFADAIVEEISHIHARWGDEVVFQLESPAIAVSYERAPRATWGPLTAILASRTAAIITATAPTTRFVLHTWCRGDLGHKPLTYLHNLAPMVRFHNQLAQRVQRANRTMPPVHAALCDGEHPPSTDPRDFTHLSRLHHHIDLIAGLVDENHPDASAAALRHTEHALGRPVRAVAAACGHGRRSVDATTANVALARRLTTQH